MLFSPGWGPPAGFLSGAFASMFGNGGLIMALYIGGRIRDKEELRATSAAVVGVNALVRVVLFAAVGLLSQEGLVLAAALLVPSLLTGLYFGQRLQKAVSAQTVLRAIYLVVAVAGACLLVRAGFETAASLSYLEPSERSTIGPALPR